MVFGLGEVAAGELLVAAEPFLSRNIHPTVIVRAFYEALEYALKTCESLAVSVDINDREAMMRLLRSAIGTKFSSRFGDLIVSPRAPSHVVRSRLGQRADGDGPRQRARHDGGGSEAIRARGEGTYSVFLLPRSPAAS